MTFTRRNALIWLSLVWLALRIYPALTGYSLRSGPEIWQAHKVVDDYGFMRLHGAQLDLSVITGRIAHPEHYIYSHYPYPLFWLYAGLYYLFGTAGPIVAVSLLKYLALVLTFLVLDQCFSRPAAFFASLLYAAAPILMLTDGNSNVVVVTSVVWPIALALIYFRFRRKEAASRGDLLLAGATTFLAGQGVWFALSVAPSLAVINSRLTSFRPRALRTALTNPVSVAFVVGGVLSLLVYLGQVAAYTEGLDTLVKYVIQKSGAAGASLPRIYLLGIVPLRISAFVGFGLALATLLACVYLVRNRTLVNELVAGSALYVAAFAAMVLLATRAFWEENHFYSWLVFPGSVLAAMLFEKIGKKLRGLILASAALGVLLALLHASVPLVSPMTRYIGRVLAAHSKKTDFIFTNIKPPGSPYKASDVGAFQETARVADRLLFYGVFEPAQLRVAKDLVDETTGFQYWKLRSLPIPSALETELNARGKLIQSIPLAFPDLKQTLAEKLRSFLWYSLMKKAKPMDLGSRPSSDVFDVYQLEPPAVKLY